MYRSPNHKYLLNFIKRHFSEYFSKSNKHYNITVQVIKTVLNNHSYVMKKTTAIPKQIEISKYSTTNYEVNHRDKTAPFLNSSTLRTNEFLPYKKTRSEIEKLKNDLLFREVLNKLKYLRPWQKNQNDSLYHDSVAVSSNYPIDSNDTIENHGGNYPNETEFNSYHFSNGCDKKETNISFCNGRRSDKCYFDEDLNHKHFLSNNEMENLENTKHITSYNHQPIESSNQNRKLDKIYFKESKEMNEDSSYYVKNKILYNNNVELKSFNMGTWVYFNNESLYIIESPNISAFNTANNYIKNLDKKKGSSVKRLNMIKCLNKDEWKNDNVVTPKQNTDDISLVVQESISLGENINRCWIPIEREYDKPRKNDTKVPKLTDEEKEENFSDVEKKYKHKINKFQVKKKLSSDSDPPSHPKNPINRENLIDEKISPTPSILSIINSVERTGAIIQKDLYITDQIMQKIQKEEEDKKQKDSEKNKFDTAGSSDNQVIHMNVHSVKDGMITLSIPDGSYIKEEHNINKLYHSNSYDLKMPSIISDERKNTLTCEDEILNNRDSYFNENHEEDNNILKTKCNDQVRDLDRVLVLYFLKNQKDVKTVSSETTKIKRYNESFYNIKSREDETIYNNNSKEYEAINKKVNDLGIFLTLKSIDEKGNMVFNLTDKSGKSIPELNLVSKINESKINDSCSKGYSIQSDRNKQCHSPMELNTTTKDDHNTRKNNYIKIVKKAQNNKEKLPNKPYSESLEYKKKKMIIARQKEETISISKQEIERIKLNDLKSIQFQVPIALGETKVRPNEISDSVEKIRQKSDRNDFKTEREDLHSQSTMVTSTNGMRFSKLVQEEKDREEKVGILSSDNISIASNYKVENERRDPYNNNSNEIKQKIFVPKRNKAGSASHNSSPTKSVEHVKKTIITSIKRNNYTDINVSEIETFVDSRLPIPFSTETFFQIFGSDSTLRDHSSIIDSTKHKLISEKAGYPTNIDVMAKLDDIQKGVNKLNLLQDPSLSKKINIPNPSNIYTLVPETKVITNPINDLGKLQENSSIKQIKMTKASPKIKIVGGEKIFYNNIEKTNPKKEEINKIEIKNKLNENTNFNIQDKITDSKPIKNKDQEILDRKKSAVFKEKGDNKITNIKNKNININNKIDQTKQTAADMKKSPMKNVTKKLNDSYVDLFDSYKNANDKKLKLPENKSMYDHKGLSKRDRKILKEITKESPKKKTNLQKIKKRPVRSIITKKILNDLLKKPAKKRTREYYIQSKNEKSQDKTTTLPIKTSLISKNKENSENKPSIKVINNEKQAVKEVFEMNKTKNQKIINIDSLKTDNKGKSIDSPNQVLTKNTPEVDSGKIQLPTKNKTEAIDKSHLGRISPVRGKDTKSIDLTSKETNEKNKQIEMKSIKAIKKEKKEKEKQIEIKNIDTTIKETKEQNNQVQKKNIKTVPKKKEQEKQIETKNTNPINKKTKEQTETKNINKKGGARSPLRQKETKSVELKPKETNDQNREKKNVNIPYQTVVKKNIEKKLVPSKVLDKSKEGKNLNAMKDSEQITKSHNENGDKKPQCHTYIASEAYINQPEKSKIIPDKGLTFDKVSKILEKTPTPEPPKITVFEKYDKTAEDDNANSIKVREGFKDDLIRKSQRKIELKSNLDFRIKTPVVKKNKSKLLNSNKPKVKSVVKTTQLKKFVDSNPDKKQNLKLQQNTKNKNNDKNLNSLNKTAKTQTILDSQSVKETVKIHKKTVSIQDSNPGQEKSPKINVKEKQSEKSFVEHKKEKIKTTDIKAKVTAENKNKDSSNQESSTALSKSAYKKDFPILLIDIDKMSKEIKPEFDKNNCQKCSVAHENIIDFPIINPKKRKSLPRSSRIITLGPKEDPLLRKELNFFPSVTKILNFTIPKDSRETLIEWRKLKISELGEDGFKQFYKGQLTKGHVFHTQLRNSLLNRKKFQNDQSHLAMKSVRNILGRLNSLYAVNSHVVHRKLAYRGVIDCVAKYQDKPLLIEWKRLENPQVNVGSSIDDASVQLSAYVGAINFDDAYKFQVSGGLLVVAYNDGSEAEVIEVCQNKCLGHWKEWLKRLRVFHDSLSKQN